MTAFHHVINGSSISGRLALEKCASDSIELFMESTYTKKAEVMSRFAGRARQVRDVFSRLTVEHLLLCPPLKLIPVCSIGIGLQI